MNFLALAEMVSKRGGAFLLEHPADPQMHPYPSIWILEAVQGLQDRAQAARVLLHQCMYGGETPKPTELLSNMDGIEEGALLCDNRHTHGTSWGKDEKGHYLTRRLQSYPGGLCRFMAWCICRTAIRLVTAGQGPGGWVGNESSAQKISGWSWKAETERDKDNKACRS